MADILIFHHGDDREAAELLAEALGKLGFEPPDGFDEADFDINPAQIRTALDLSVVGIALWSPSAVASESFHALAAQVSAKGRLFSMRGPNARAPIDFDDPPAFLLDGWTGDLKHPGLVDLANLLASRYGVRRHWAAAAMQAKPTAPAKVAAKVAAAVVAPAIEAPKSAPWIKPAKAPKQQLVAAAPAAPTMTPAQVAARATLTAPLASTLDPRDQPIFKSWKKPRPAPAPVTEIPADILAAVAEQEEAKAEAAAKSAEPAPPPATPMEEPVFKFMSAVRRKTKAERVAEARTAKAEPKPAPVVAAKPAPVEKKPEPTPVEAKPEPLPVVVVTEPVKAEPSKPAQPITYAPAEPRRADWVIGAEAFAMPQGAISHGKPTPVVPSAPLFVDEPAPVVAADAEEDVEEKTVEAAIPPAAVIAAMAPPVVEPVPAPTPQQSGFALMTGTGALAGALAGVVSAVVANQGVTALLAPSTENQIDAASTAQPNVSTYLSIESDARDASGFTTVAPQPARAAVATPAPAPARTAAAEPVVQRVNRNIERDTPRAERSLPAETDDEALTRALNMHMLSPTAASTFEALPADIIPALQTQDLAPLAPAAPDSLAERAAALESATQTQAQLEEGRAL